MPPQCKITVLKKMLNEDLAKEYCQNEVAVCPVFEEGQEFIAGFEKPEGFCDWAWNDIYKFVAVLLSGGNFSRDIFEAIKNHRFLMHVKNFQFFTVAKPLVLQTCENFQFSRPQN